MQKLPILQIVRHSLAYPFFAPTAFLKPLGIMFGIVVAWVLISFLLGGFSMLEVFEEMAAQGSSNSQEMAEAAGPQALMFSLSILIGMVLLLLAVSHLFNICVRVGAKGPGAENFASFGEAMSAAGVNSLKFFGIGVIILLVSLVVLVVFNVLGLSPGFEDQLEASAQQDVAAMTRAGFLTNLVVTIISCGVYSLLSSNLTQTAMASEAEGLTHPHNVDFAIVLVLLYAVVLLPVTLAGLTGSFWLMQAANFILGLWVMLAVGVAHGIRYRVCVTGREGTVFD